MKAQYHVVLSVAVAGLLYAGFRSWAMAASSLVAGVLLDLDHLIDYYVEYGIPRTTNDFLDACYERRMQRALLLFHAWEWLLLLGVLAVLSGGNEWLLGALIGTAHHLVCDQVTNEPRSWGYSILWRLRHRCRTGRVFRPDRRPDGGDR